MLYIVLGIIMVFFAWMQAATSKMQKFKNQARSHWVRIDASLQTRAQYLLGLLEIADENGFGDSDLMAEIYEMGGGYCKSEDREVISQCAENATPLIDRFLELTQGNAALESNEDFQELTTNLVELEEEIEIQSERYNHSIDLYNEHLANPRLRLQFMILGPPQLKGIHLRAEEATEDRTEEGTENPS